MGLDTIGSEVDSVVDVGKNEVIGSVVDEEIFGGMIGDWEREIRGFFNCSLKLGEEVIVVEMGSLVDVLSGDEGMGSVVIGSEV